MDEISTYSKEKDNRDIAENHGFKTPVKCIKSAQDISIWEKSEAYQVMNTRVHTTVPPAGLSYGGGADKNSF